MMTTPLRHVLDPDSCIYLVERSRSRSDQTSHVDMCVVEVDRSVRSIGADVAAFCDLSYSAARRGIVFHAPMRPETTALMLGRKLFGDGSHVRTEWL